MKMFDLKGVIESLNSPNINSLLKSIEMYKGKTLRVSKLKKLEKMMAFARKKSVIDSCFVGNVFLTEQREKDLFEKINDLTKVFAVNYCGNTIIRESIFGIV